MPIELLNKGSYEFIDISSEEWREYRFSDGNLIYIRGHWLAVTDSGHRVLDADGISHFIPYGWIHLKWKSIPHFVK